MLFDDADVLVEAEDGTGKYTRGRFRCVLKDKADHVYSVFPRLGIEIKDPL